MYYFKIISKNVSSYWWTDDTALWLGVKAAFEMETHKIDALVQELTPIDEIAWRMTYNDLEKLKNVTMVYSATVWLKKHDDDLNDQIHMKNLTCEEVDELYKLLRDDKSNVRGATFVKTEQSSASEYTDEYKKLLKGK